MYTPHTITLCNASENPETGAREYRSTVLDGVFLERIHAETPSTTGMENADTATVYIPFTVHAEAAETGAAQQYASPKEYHRAADKTPYWTIRASGRASAVDCFFVRGRIDTPGSYQELNAQYDDVYRVSTVDTLDFGSAAMQHWKVGGR